MADRILLKCNDNTEVVTAFNRAYPVKDGFALIDVTSHRAADPLNAPRLDAALDAAEICKQATVTQLGPYAQLVPRFRAANQDEVNAWIAKNQPAKGKE